MTDLTDLILLAAERCAMTKTVLSKPDNPAERRTVLTPCKIGEELMIRRTTYFQDNKVGDGRIALSDREGLEGLLNGYRQVNLFTTVGDCERRKSKSGTETLLGGDALARALRGGSEPPRVTVGGVDRKKARILSGEEPFLRLLGISDASGRVHDKKQAKFRQINRFLELIRDCLPALPAEGSLRICDLCCGKSYLSFAVYHYFTNILGREVLMTGVDLKPDVMELCNRTARTLGFTGLTFLCGDVSRYEAEKPVHLVMSLHACDVATDYVLSRAVAWEADVILSTPCCHHELNRELDCEPLIFLSDYSMLRQKFCDAATDALRLKYLEAN